MRVKVGRNEIIAGLGNSRKLARATRSFRDINHRAHTLRTTLYHTPPRHARLPRTNHLNIDHHSPAHLHPRLVRSLSMMASSISPLPPTPQQSLAHLQGMHPPQASPPQQVPPSAYGNSYNMIFDSSQQSQGVIAPSYSQSFPNSQQGSFSNGPVSSTGVGYSRSFGGRYPAPGQYEDSTQIYTVRVSRRPFTELDLE